MNALVQTALAKLIQDETFRTELVGMIDTINRETDLVSREQEGEEKKREDVVAPEPPTDAKFADVKDAILADPTFLKALVDALMQANQPAETARSASAIKLQDSIDALSKQVGELGTTINEHDKVLTEMAEKALISEGEKPLLIRARTEQKGEKATSTLEARAARVLTKMGAQNAS